MKKITVPFRNSILRLPWRRYLALIIVVLTGFALPSRMQAVSPAPDGGYGGQNTAEGTDALFNVTTAVWNSAVGFRALYKNAAGIRNVAVGYQALYNDNGPSSDHYVGYANVAVGANALFHNTTGNSNVAIGDFALYDNTTGSNNIAIGSYALRHFNGDGNTVVGDSFSSDPDNVSVGRLPVLDPRQGRTHDGVLTAYINAQNDIFVGSIADIGAGETFYTPAVHIQAQNDIYIGLPNPQTQRVHITATEAVFAAPVFSNPIAGSPVTIDSSGQLGVAPSSRRFKQEIKPLDKASETVLSLKPVAFRYKKELDPKATPQFGLVAEEVEKVNPDLVVRDSDGKPYSVRYDAVNAMLLNEFLKEHRKVEELESAVAQLTAHIKEQDSKMQKLTDQVAVSKSPDQVAVNQ